MKPEAEAARRTCLVPLSPVLHVAMATQGLLHVGVSQQGGPAERLHPDFGLAGGGCGGVAGVGRRLPPLLQGVLPCGATAAPPNVTRYGHLHPAVAAVTSF